MLIGLFGFYAKWIPWYEDIISPWRAVLKKKPPVDTDTEEEERMLTNLWTPKEDSLIHVLKKAILTGPVLKRPDWDRQFHVKTDWSSFAKGGALCQAECTPEAEEAIRKESEEGTPAEFDKTISGLRLRPIAFISKRNTIAECSHHSSVGELATGRWAFLKWKKYLWFRLFLWYTDCNGIIKFWVMDLMPTHQCQRWKVDMLRYDFDAKHRSEYMLCECNLISRYNQHATKLRMEEAKAVAIRDARIEEKLSQGVSPNKGTRRLAEPTVITALFAVIPSIDLQRFPTFATMVNDFRATRLSYHDHPGFSNRVVSCVGVGVFRSFLADICDPDRLMGTMTPSGISLIGIAKAELNMPSLLVFEAAGKQAWQEMNNLPGPVKLSKMLMTPETAKEVDWMWIELGSVPRADILTVRLVITSARQNGCKAVIFYWCLGGDAMESKAKEWMEWCEETLTDWKPSRCTVQNTHCGGPIRYTTNLLLLLPMSVSQLLGPFDEVDEPEAMEAYLDDSNMRYSDYISGWSLRESRTLPPEGTLPLQPVVDSVIEWKMEHWAVFHSCSVAPEVANRSGDLQDYQFLLSVSDSGM
jgi:hypothetical protein